MLASLIQQVVRLLVLNRPSIKKLPQGKQLTPLAVNQSCSFCLYISTNQLQKQCALVLWCLDVYVFFRFPSTMYLILVLKSIYVYYIVSPVSYQANLPIGMLFYLHDKIHMFPLLAQLYLIPSRYHQLYPTTGSFIAYFSSFPSGHSHGPSIGFCCQLSTGNEQESASPGSSERELELESVGLELSFKVRNVRGFLSKFSM